ncbi:hypothetical protein HPG69_018348 [Diceros bicornis minor]|uniref:CCDC81 HU domain-containing protein n=1 Tax=Diceros bicornis minor TaxID=77932 RepID=A0A7J7FGM1_DICBM|nr:hypothetical protein HPG69_018348 [Diceros bicornis minor]
MLDTIAPSVQDLGRQVLPTLPSLSQEVNSVCCSFFPPSFAFQGVQIPGLGTFTFMRQKLEVGNNKFILIQRPIFIMAEKLVQIHGLKQNKVYTPGKSFQYLRLSQKRPGTVDSVLSSREALGKRPNSVLAFPRIELREMENKPPMETIVEEGRKNRQRKYKLKDQSDKEEGVREILSPKRIQDRQALSPGKVTSASLLNKLERSGSGGKNMNPEGLSSPDCLKNDNEMKPKISPAPACQDHNKAGQMKSLANRERNQKNAAYNLGVAEAIRIHKNEKPEFYVRVFSKFLLLIPALSKSFLFDKRPLSPEINAFKQEEYFQNLLKQMDNRREKEIKQRQNRELMDRLEQVQLTEELAAQRAKYIKDKMEETQCYKRALDAQIKNKPPQLPMFEPDSFEPIFGENEGKLMVEKRKREQNYMKHQLEAAASHKRKAILHQLVDQKRDLQMLQRTQKEHLADRTAELERVNRINQSLQEDWERSAAMKRQRDLEEKAFERASDKLFLLDQCEKYRRCKQCQRSTSNVGESNLWPLNKYLYGSRLFV